MPHSSEAVDSPASQSQSSSPGMQPWSPEVGRQSIHTPMPLIMGMPHSLCLSLRSTLSGQEDAVLLRHALQCGTKQWGELERSGQLKRNNKSCCNRYIFLRRKFTDRFRQNFLRKHLGAAALLQHIPLDGHSQALLCQDLKQQQSEHSEGVGAAALAFGGLSYECVMAFFAPHARCCLPPAPPNLSSLVATPPLAPPPASQAPPPASQAPPPASQAAPFPAAVASTSECPFARDVVPVAAASTAAALRRPAKRPRGDCPGLTADQPVLWGNGSWVVRGGVACGTERRRQSVAEQFQQQGASSRVQQQGASSLVQETEEAALLEALLQEEHRQQRQGGVGSRAQRVLWPRVGSESALPDDVLLKSNNGAPAFTQRAALSVSPPSQLFALPGSTPRNGDSTAWCGDSAPCIEDFAMQRVDWPPVGSESALPDEVLLGLCCEDPAFMQGTAFSAPLPTQPLAPLPTAMLPKLAALSGSAPCIGDGSTLQQVEWPRVGSESALPDDVLLGLCCEGPASAQLAALSAPPPTQPRAPAALCASAPGSTSSCISAVLAGSTCGTEEQEYVDACIDALWNGSNTDNNSNGSDNNSNGADNGGIDNHSDRDMGALFLNTPVVHVLLSGSALTMPLPSGPQSQGPAPPCAAGTAVSEWAVEQGVTGEEGRQLHRQQQFLTNPDTAFTLGADVAAMNPINGRQISLDVRCYTNLFRINLLNTSGDGING
ncbi:unnamed protein product [Closterium sp. NIES-65]|nr:unnamed protein product [Closterium sp. NIES-65]